MRNLFIFLAALLINGSIALSSNAESSKRVSLISNSNIIDSLSVLREDGATPSAKGPMQAGRILSKPLKLRLKVNGIGRFDSVLDYQKFFGVKDSVFLQGRVRHFSEKNDERYSSFATIEGLSSTNKKIRLFVYAKSRVNAPTTWKGLLEVNAFLSGKEGQLEFTKAKMRKSKRGTLKKLECINHKHGKELQGSTLKGTPSAKANLQTARIILDSDFEYESQIPGTISSEIATIMNGVDAKYRRDLKLSFDTVINPDPVDYSYEIAEDEFGNISIHDEMKIKRPADSRDSDIHFLFTGKTPVGEDLADLAGVVADLGTVCSDPVNSVGITIRIDTPTDIVVTSHEIGHLFNAEHDDDFTNPRRPNIMSSVIDSNIKKFSKYSKNQVANFVAENGFCLGSSDGGGTPPTSLPATADIYSYKDGSYFVAEIYDLGDNSGYSGVSVDVYYRANSRSSYSLSKTLTSDGDGLVYFVPKQVGSYFFQAGTLKSKVLKKR